MPETAKLDAFVAVIDADLASRGAKHTATPTDGHEWTWTHRGVWTLRAGSILEPGVQLTGPPGSWKCPPASLRSADQVLLLLVVADALPPVSVPYRGYTEALDDAVADLQRVASRPAGDDPPAVARADDDPGRRPHPTTPTG